MPLTALLLIIVYFSIYTTQDQGQAYACTEVHLYLDKQTSVMAKPVRPKQS